MTRFNPPLGTPGNAWNNVATGANGNSAALNTYNAPFVSAFGNVNGATTLTLQYSADNTNFYAGPTTTLSGAGNFHIDATCGAQYVRLQSSNNVTATATIQAKE